MRKEKETLHGGLTISLTLDLLLSVVSGALSVLGIVKLSSVRQPCTAECTA